MNKLLVYTRKTVSEEIYSAKLADSMHLAVFEGNKYIGLNHNSGVLYVKATEKPNGALNAKNLKQPMVVKGADCFYIFAVRVCSHLDYDDEDAGMLVEFTTKDFVHYEETGLVAPGTEVEQGVFAHAAEPGNAELTTSLEGTELPEGAVPCCLIEVEDSIEDYLRRKLITPVNTSVEFPAVVSAASKEELEEITATAHYSDGSQCRKKIDWNLENVDFSKPGSYQIEGLVHRPHFDFPIAINRADPCVARWNGKYYFIATNDADGNHSLYIREADTLDGLVNAEEHLLLDSTTFEGIGGLLWAPEFHEVNGRLYIFHAATPGEFFCEESRIMSLREGGNPIDRNDWSGPKRIVRKDGTDICEMGKEITLDMTCFPWEGDYYVVWSERQFLPEDLGAWLYIAKLDPKEPYKLLTDPVILSKPEYGWANNHTFVDEGPFALIRGDKIFLTFSSAAVDSTYVVASLTITRGQDLLDPKQWVKSNYPLFSSRSVEGEYGTGHNAYVEDEDGVIWNTYHARPGVDGPRSSGFRRVHFGFDGEPVLDMTEEKDVLDSLRKVTARLIVK